jgi:small subunit ribosomal protein S16
VAVKIKLKRLGKIRAPYYRIVVADARTKRDGRAIEEIGKYHPKAEPSFIEVKSDRAQHWLSVGAQPTDPVRKILEITGDWQRFKGLPGAEGTLRTAAPKEDRKEIFAAAVKETLGDAAPKGRGKSSGSGRDSDSGADKGGRAAAKDGSQSKPEKPARAKDKARSGEAKDAAADTDAAAKASKAEASKAEASKAEDGKAKASQAEDGKAEAGKAEAGKAKASKAEDGKPEASQAEDGKAEDSQAESDSAAVAADADSASRD